MEISNNKCKYLSDVLFFYFAQGYAGVSFNIRLLSCDTVSGSKPPIVSRILFQQPYESVCGQLNRNMFFFFFGSNIGVYAYLLLGSEGVFGHGNGET